MSFLAYVRAYPLLGLLGLLLLLKIVLILYWIFTHRPEE